MRSVETCNFLIDLYAWTRVRWRLRHVHWPRGIHPRTRESKLIGLKIRLGSLKLGRTWYIIISLHLWIDARSTANIAGPQQTDIQPCTIHIYNSCSTVLFAYFNLAIWNIFRLKWYHWNFYCTYLKDNWKSCFSNKKY